MAPTRRRILAAVAASASLAGCTGEDAPETVAGPTATDTPTETATGTEAGTETEGESVGQREYPDYDWEKLEGVQPESTTEIGLGNSEFQPLIAAVPAGSTVTWQNDDSFDHTVTIPALDVDRTLGGDESTTLTVEEPGTYDYVCTFHPPGMLGRLVVTDGTPTEASMGATVQVRDHEDLGEILVDSEGMTLYMFDSDTQGDGESTCYDDCADAWPPLTVDGEPTAGDGVTADLSTFERDDGSTQVAAGGWPLYYFVNDEEPGDVEGQGVSDVWWVLRPDGTPVRSSTAMPDETETPTPTATDDDGGYY